jgi:hypothetical protein
MPIYNLDRDTNIEMGIKVLKTTDNLTSFISQRSRLNLDFKQDRLKLKLSLQNVRTWGDKVLQQLLTRMDAVFYIC